MRSRRNWAILIGVLLLAGLLVTAWRLQWLAEFEIGAVRTFIEGFGALAIVVYIVLLAVNTVTIMPPTAILIFSAGILFPPVQGIFALWCGQVLGSIAAFFIARYVAQDFVSRHVHGRAADFNEQLKESGFTVVFLARVVGLPPYELVNYAAGASKIPFKSFLLATMLGPIASVVIIVITGDRLLNFDWRDPLVYVLPVFVIVTAILSRIINQRRRKLATARQPLEGD